MSGPGSPSERPVCALASASKPARAGKFHTIALPGRPTVAVGSSYVGSQLIPARIIQTWKTRVVPARYKRFQHAVRTLNPGYEMLLFTDAEMSDFVSSRYPEYRETFEALPSIISKTDLFRILAVHGLGGFYLDLDVALIRSIEPLRSHSCVFPFENIADTHFIRRYGVIGLIGQYAFGAAPGHPFLLAYADNIKRVVADPSLLDAPSAELLALTHEEDKMVSDTLYRTGPRMANRTYIEHPELQDGIKIIYAQKPDGTKVWSSFGIYGFHLMDGDTGWKGRRDLSLAKRIRRRQWQAAQIKALHSCTEP